VTDFDRALEQLRDEVEFPPTPPIAARVGARIRAGRRRRSRRMFVLVPAAALVAAGIVVAATPAARHAFEDLFGIRGATVRRVPTLPRLERTPLPLGRRVSLAEAERLAGFRVLLPAGLGKPDAVYYSTFTPGGEVNLAYRSSSKLPRVSDLRAGLVLGELRSRDEPFISKLVAGTSPRRLKVAGRPALWIDVPHAFMFRRPNAQTEGRFLLVRGNVLLVERGPLLVRIESRLSQRESVRIGRSLRPVFGER
jgi:hypothetical protein